MKALFCSAASLFLIAAGAAAADLDPCALVRQAEVPKIIGEIKEVKTIEGLRKENEAQHHA